jgi:hypothetical protein
MLLARPWWNCWARFLFGFFVVDVTFIRDMFRP